MFNLSFEDVPEIRGSFGGVSIKDIANDEVLGAYMALGYLIDCERRRIAFVNGSGQFEISREQLEDFHKAINAPDYWL